MMRIYLAEFIGTFALVFCGTGAIIINDISGGQITSPGIAITFGLIVMAMIYTLGDISGAHINPAVTIAFMIAGKFSGKKSLPYIISQVAGALSASFMLSLLFPAHPHLGATIPAGAVLQSFILEVILTCILMLVILRVSQGSKEQGLFAGIAIGSVVLLEAMFAGPVSGASMNPARSFAPALLSGHMQHVWIYLLAPVIGAVGAVPIWKCLEEKRL